MKLARAAAAIAVGTAAARVVGFARTAVLSRTLGPTCVGDVYQAVNAVPNVLYEVVAGGALATAVVPLLAAAVQQSDRDTAQQTARALLTWTMLVLLVPTLLAALFARPLVGALLGARPGCPGATSVGVRLLLVFLPQVLLYGAGVVLSGVLQAHRRFLGPTFAPLLSSAVVIAAYLLYAAGGRPAGLAGLSRTQELVLSAGTTLGVAVLSLSLLVPLRATGVRLRPALAFPPGVAARARSLALGGVAGLVAQQLALVVALRLAGGGPPGSVVVLTTATAVFVLPWAVLVVPVATSAFPELSAAAARGQEAAYARTASRALRAVLVAGAGGAALLLATAGPAAQVLVLRAPGGDSTGALAAAVRALAPGLVGYALLALLGRALYARGAGRAAAVATAAAWLGVAAADVVLVLAAPGLSRVTALGLGNTVGMTLGGVLLLRALVRTVGRAPLQGAGRAGAAATIAAALAVGAAHLLPVPDPTSALASAGSGLLLAAVAALVFLGALRALDPAGVRVLLHG